MANEFASLTELAAESGGAISRSTLNRRLKRIIEISKGMV